MLRILVNFSADDNSNVLQELMLPHYEFLTFINKCLVQYSSSENLDDQLVANVLWILGNLIGDNDSQISTAVMENTDLFNFINTIAQIQKPLASNLMTIVPWLINSII